MLWHLTRRNSTLGLELQFMGHLLYMYRERGRGKQAFTHQSGDNDAMMSPVYHLGLRLGSRMEQHGEKITPMTMIMLKLLD